jgi:hypothetical protein
MTRIRVTFPIVAAAVAALLSPPAVVAQDEVVGHRITMSESLTSVAFDLADGASRLITVGGGRVLVDGQEVATYDVRSAFDDAWMAILESGASQSTAGLLMALEAWSGSVDSDASRAVAATLDRLEFDAAAVPTLAAAPRAPSPRPARERIQVVIPDIPEIVIPKISVSTGGSAVQIADAPAPPMPSTTSTSMVGAVGAGVASLGASLIAMMLMAFGFLIFAPHQFRAVGDTAWNSFGRSFLAGFFAQPLLVPVLGALVVALALTVVGILLIPLAIPAFALAVFLGITGGYIAIARTVGEVYLRRRNGGAMPTEPWVELKFVLYGLTAMLGIWIPAVLLGWIPVVGPLFTIVAGVFTWVLATAGFGASIISRGGVRGTVIRRLDRTLSEGDYWSDTGAFRRARSHAEYE